MIEITTTSKHWDNYCVNTINLCELCVNTINNLIEVERTKIVQSWRNYYKLNNHKFISHCAHIMFSTGCMHVSVNLQLKGTKKVNYMNKWQIQSLFTMRKYIRKETNHSLTKSHSVWSSLESIAALIGHEAVWPDMSNNQSVTNPVYDLPITHHQKSPTVQIDSHTTQTVTLTLDFSSHNPFRSDYAHGCSQSHSLHKPWTSSLSLPSII